MKILFLIVRSVLLIFFSNKLPRNGIKMKSNEKRKIILIDVNIEKVKNNPANNKFDKFSFFLKKFAKK